MIEGGKKIRMRQTVEIYDETKLVLKELSKKLRLSETKIINEAIIAYGEKGSLSSGDLEKIISALEESTWGLQLRLNSREASINSQVMLEMMNTLTQNSKEPFAPTYTSPSSIYKNSKKRIEDKINNRKARKNLL